MINTSYSSAESHYSLLRIASLTKLIHNKNIKPVVKSSLLPAIILVSSLVIKTLETSGYLVYDHTSNFALRTVPSADFFPSLWTATTQLLDMTGANIFGRLFGFSLISPFVALSIVVISIYGLCVAGNFTLKRLFRNKKMSFHDLSIASISLTAFSAFFIYVFSSQVVKRLPDGTIVTANQQRYLTILPFILVFGLVWVYINKLKVKSLRAILLVVLMLGIVTGFDYVRNNYAARQSRANQLNTSFMQVAKELQQEDISVLLAGHWYNAPVRFWSSNTIKTTSIHGCDQKFPFLIRDEWFKSTNASHTALMVDYSGIDKISLGCPTENISTIFGTPYKIIEVPGTQNNVIKLLLFDYDIRGRLR